MVLEIAGDKEVNWSVLIHVLRLIAKGVLLFLMFVLETTCNRSACQQDVLSRGAYLAVVSSLLLACCKGLCRALHGVEHKCGCT
jgi:hypothetical protein